MNATEQQHKAERFLDLHHGERPLLLANAWDAGSARLLEWAGFDALATTSSGHAASLGRLDYEPSREDALANGAAIAAASALPVSADLADCYGADAAAVAETVGLAREAGLCGCSIEDWGASAGGLYEPGEAAERVAAAAQAAHAGAVRLVLTARAENYLRGNPDIDDTVARLRAFEEAGADVLYAPAVKRTEDIRAIVSSVSLPVNVLALEGVPSVAELAELGVARVSVGGGFAFAAYAAALSAARELMQSGTYGYTEMTAQGARAAREAFAR